MDSGFIIVEATHKLNQYFTPAGAVGAEPPVVVVGAEVGGVVLAVPGVHWKYPGSQKLTQYRRDESVD